KRAHRHTADNQAKRTAATVNSSSSLLLQDEGEAVGEVEVVDEGLGVAEEEL
ncbi:hypothetical protein GOODEAATRI_009299, partial [Goodea atripinnis]